MQQACVEQAHDRVCIFSCKQQSYYSYLLTIETYNVRNRAHATEYFILSLQYGARNAGRVGVNAIFSFLPITVDYTFCFI